MVFKDFLKMGKFFKDFLRNLRTSGRPEFMIYVCLF
jgi:hypothetical protein